MPGKAHWRGWCDYCRACIPYNKDAPNVGINYDYKTTPDEEMMSGSLSCCAECLTHKFIVCADDPKVYHYYEDVYETSHCLLQ